MRIPIDEDMMRQSLVRTFKVGKLPGSFTNGDGNIIGFLGEAAFQKAFPNAEHVDDFENDFMILGNSVDVKSQRMNVEARPEFDFTVHFKKEKKETDFYAFAVVYSHFKFVDLVGYSSGDYLLRECERIEAGDPMPQGGTYKASGRRIYIHQMQKFKKEGEQNV